MRNRHLIGLLLVFTAAAVGIMAVLKVADKPAGMLVTSLMVMFPAFLGTIAYDFIDEIIDPLVMRHRPITRTQHVLIAVVCSLLVGWLWSDTLPMLRAVPELHLWEFLPFTAQMMGFFACLTFCGGYFFESLWNRWVSKR